MPASTACRLWVVSLGCLLWALACQPSPKHLVTDAGVVPLPPDMPTRPLARLGASTVLLGARVPQAPVQPGQALAGVVWLRCDATPCATNASVQLWGDAAEMPQAKTMLRALPVVAVGDVTEQRFTLNVPAALALDEADLRVVLLDQDKRPLPVQAASLGGPRDNRIGRVKIQTTAPATHIDIHKGTVVVDGQADDAWANTPAFVLWAYDGLGRITRTTHVRFLWDDAALYAWFDVVDPDPFTPYQRRDDPLYEAEATELFVDGDGDATLVSGDYVELQSTFNDLHFDAAFRGGRRANMQVQHDVPFVTVSRVTSTGYVQEWRVPLDAIEVKNTPGTQLRLNVFRLERLRDDAKQKTLRSEASALLPPLSRDFHNVARLVTATLLDGPSAQ